MGEKCQINGSNTTKSTLPTNTQLSRLWREKKENKIDRFDNRVAWRGSSIERRLDPRSMKLLDPFGHRLPQLPPSGPAPEVIPAVDHLHLEDPSTPSCSSSSSLVFFRPSDGGSRAVACLVRRLAAVQFRPWTRGWYRRGRRRRCHWTSVSVSVSRSGSVLFLRAIARLPAPRDQRLIPLLAEELILVSVDEEDVPIGVGEERFECERVLVRVEEGEEGDHGSDGVGDEDMGGVFDLGRVRFRRGRDHGCDEGAVGVALTTTGCEGGVCLSRKGRCEAHDE